MDLPPGPRAPAAWQTIAWMARPGAFLRGVHDRFGDPVTIRTYWTEEPMVLFSGPDAVREVFRLDPAIAPAGQSWEFLRPFAGPHSILLLDGEEHLRERRLLQTPFHGERMRALAPIVAELARRELGAWRGRVIALERMRQLTLEIILRVVFGAHDEQEAAQLRDAVEGTLASVRSSSTSTPCCSTSSRAGGPSRAATRCSRCCSSSETRTATRRPTGTCATSSSRCSSAATTARRHRWPGRLSGSRATPRCTRASEQATPPTSMRSSRRCCVCVPR